MSYIKMTQDQLWESLRHVDAKIAAYPPSLGGGEYLHQERCEIIQAFIDYWGYNPDNLCIAKDEEIDLHSFRNR